MSEEKRVFKAKWCRYEFSAEEMKEIASIMAIKTQELDDIELQKKSAMSAFKEKLDSCKLDVSGRARQYTDGYEMRDIECEMVKDYEQGIVSYIRTDTGQVARSTR